MRLSRLPLAITPCLSARVVTARPGGNWDCPLPEPDTQRCVRTVLGRGTDPKCHDTSFQTSDTEGSSPVPIYAKST
eukprot:6193930-Pleurochrysis_carterae.AAC.1